LLVRPTVRADLRPPSRALGGFTLVEGLIVMTVLGLLLAAALPSFAEFGRNQRLRAAAYDLVADLLLARSEAIKRASPVSVVPVAGWNGGWTVRVDGGLHAGTVVQRRDGPGEGIDVARLGAIAFDRDGRLLGGGTARIPIADGPSRVVKRCIVVDLSGMPASRSGPCG
jgi:type IV fimbrial biogenesis protein FimT